VLHVVARRHGGKSEEAQEGKGLIIFISQSKMFLISPSARVAELADALDLGSSTERYRGSNPLSRTTLFFFPILHLNLPSEILTGLPVVVYCNTGQEV
jgi:hypothetical protein